MPLFPVQKVPSLVLRTSRTSNSPMRFPCQLSHRNEHKQCLEELIWAMQCYFIAGLLTLLTSSQGILTTLSQSNGGYSYDYATVPFLAEVFKVYSTSMAMLLTMVVSIFLFNFKPTVQLLLGIIICMMSLQMYFAPANMLIDLLVAYRAEPEMKNEVIIERRTAS